MRLALENEREEKGYICSDAPGNNYYCVLANSHKLNYYLINKTHTYYNPFRFRRENTIIMRKAAAEGSRVLIFVRQLIS